MKKCNAIHASNLILLIVLLLISVSSVFAYFTFLSNTVNIGLEVNGNRIAEIFNETQLTKLATDTNYNSNNSLSSGASRYTAQLKNSLKLSRDVVITNDIGIDLDTHNLDLNGHQLIFRHNYSGQIAIKGLDANQLTSSVDGGKIVLQTPYAILADTTLSTSNPLIEVSAFNEVQLVAEIENFVKKHINGIYISDIVLVDRYLSYNIDFDYKSSNESIINNQGKLVNRPTLIEDGSEVGVNMQFNLVLSGGGLSSEYNLVIPFEVAVLSGDDQQDKINIANNYLKLFFANRYLDGIYFLRENILLPMQDKYLDLQFDYSVTGSAGLSSVVDTGVKILMQNNMPGEAVLQPTVLIGEVSVLLNTFTFSSILDSNYETATKLMETFKQNLVFTSIESKDIRLVNETENSTNGITSISYALEGNTFDDGGEKNYVTLVDGLFGKELKVVNMPTKETDVKLVVTFNFVSGSPLNIIISAPIYFALTGEGGEGGTSSKYYFYYTKVLEQFLTATDGGKTTNSFFLMDSYLNVLIKYELTSEIEGLAINEPINSTYKFEINKLELPRQNQEVVIKVSFAPKDSAEVVIWEEYDKPLIFLINGVVLNNSKGIVDTNLFNTLLAKMNVDLDITETVLYSDYIDTVTELILSDIDITQGFGGIEFYTNLVSLSVTNCNFGNINNNMLYLNKMPKLATLSLMNNNLTASSLDGIKFLYALKSLNISNNNIGNLSALSTNTSITSLNAENCNLTDIDKLNSFPSLIVLDVSSTNSTRVNLIEDYRILLSLSKLKTVNCYDTTSNATHIETMKYNISTFVLLAYSNVEIYNGFANDKILFVSNADQLECVNVIEAITSFTLTNNQIIVVKELTFGSSYYKISWDLTALGSVTTIDNDNGLTMTINHTLTTGKYRIRATVYSRTVNGVETLFTQTQQVWKYFVVQKGGSV